MQMDVQRLFLLVYCYFHPFEEELPAVVYDITHHQEQLLEGIKVLVFIPKYDLQLSLLFPLDACTVVKNTCNVGCVDSGLFGEKNNALSEGSSFVASLIQSRSSSSDKRVLIRKCSINNNNVTNISNKYADADVDEQIKVDILVLQRMHRIMVRLNAVSTDLSSSRVDISQLRFQLQLYDVLDMSKNTNNSSISRRLIVQQSSNNSVFKYSKVLKQSSKDSIPVVDIDPVDHITSNISNTRSDDKRRNKENKLFVQNCSKWKSTIESNQHIRCAIKNSTRIAFGVIPTSGGNQEMVGADLSDDADATTEGNSSVYDVHRISPIYLRHPSVISNLLHSVHSPTDDGVLSYGSITARVLVGKSKSVEARAVLTARESYELARARMQTQGEVWMDEEELPSSTTNTNVETDNGSNVVQGTRPIQLNMVLSRQSKLRVAKQSSKYK